MIYKTRLVRVFYAWQNDCCWPAAACCSIIFLSFDRQLATTSINRAGMYEYNFAAAQTAEYGKHDTKAFTDRVEQRLTFCLAVGGKA
jgi:hypothetical protein